MMTEGDRVAGWCLRTCWVAMVGAFEGPFGHFAFDDPWIDPQPAFVQPLQDLAKLLR